MFYRLSFASKRTFAVFLSLLLVVCAIPAAPGAAYAEDALGSKAGVASNSPASEVVVQEEEQAEAANITDRSVSDDCDSRSSEDLLVTTEDGSVLKWKKDGTVNAKIVGYVSLTENLIVPAEIEGLKVIALADMVAGGTLIPNSTFAEADTLKSVVLPDSVKLLSGFDFQGCTSLESIRMSPNVVYIGMGAFEGCSSLKQIELPSGLANIDQVLFESCTSLENVVLPSGLTSIGAGAFAGCSSLTEISLPSKLTSIGGGAFEGSGLISVELPSSLRTVAATAFRTESLANAYIPRSVTDIGDAAFSASTLILTDCVRNCAAKTYAQDNGNTYIAGDLDDYWKSSVSAEVSFTGAEQMPEITLATYYGDIFPMEFAKLSYINNVNCGRASCDITSDVVKGSQRVNFSIVRTSIDDDGVQVSDIPTQKYTGVPLEPHLAITLGGYVLQEGTDFTCTYEDNSGLSDKGRVVIAGKGNFEGARIVEFDVIDEGDTSVLLAETQTSSFSFAEQTPVNARACIEAPENQEIFLSVGLYNVSGETTITLKGSDGKEQLLGDFKDGESASRGSYSPIMIPKGSYVLTVTGGVSKGSSSPNLTMYYSVKGEYENHAMEFEPNDTASSATSVGVLGYDGSRLDAGFVGSLYKPVAAGTSRQGEDKDFFRFTLEDYGATSICLETLDVLDYSVCDSQGEYVRSSSGDEVRGVTDSGSSKKLIDCGTLNPGDYYLILSGDRDHLKEAQVYKGAVRIDSCGGFADVDTGTAHYMDIAWLAGKGVSAGWVDSDGTRTFRPYNDVARADMAAFLYRLAGSPEYTAPGISPFRDVDSSTAHYKEICWLADVGISQGWGTPDGREFRPYATVARCDMAAFLYRLAGSPSYSVSGSPFVDCSGETPHYTEVCWLAEKGISAGWSTLDGKEFRPYNTVARADMAAFLHRMKEGGLV